MDSNRKTAIVVGVLFIIATVTVILGGLLLGSLDAPDYLTAISANENQVLGGVIIQFMWPLAVVGIPVALFPILKRHNETLALGFFSLRLVEAVFSFVYIISQLSLLTLSQEFVVGALDASYYQTSGVLIRAVRDWSFAIGPGIVFALSALTLNYILYQSKLIPRWLSIWGLIGAILLFASNLVEFLFLPIFAQEMVFAVWLIVKGFNSSEMTS